MKIRTILSNLVIILSLCFLTFAVLDWYILQVHAPSAV